MRETVDRVRSRLLAGALVPGLAQFQLPTTTTAPVGPTTTTEPLLGASPSAGDLAKSFEHYWYLFIAKLPAILTALVVFVVLVQLGRLARHVVERALGRTSTEAHIHLLVGKLAYFGAVVVALVVALAILGVNIGLLFGSLGLASVAIGFALQDILANFVAGVVLLFERSFTRGDYVITPDAQGTVVDIRVRATLLRTPDGQLVLVPNKLLLDDVMTNSSATERRRLQVVVNVPYTEDTARTRTLLIEATRGVDSVLEEPAPQLLTQDFGQGALQLLMWFWVDPRTTDMLQVRSQVLDTIERTLREAEVDLAVPTLIGTVPVDEAERRGVDAAVTVRGTVQASGEGSGQGTVKGTGARVDPVGDDDGQVGRRDDDRDDDGQGRRAKLRKERRR